MRKTVTAVAACCTLILFFGCNRQAVSLDYTNAKDEVMQLQNLIFRFNKSLVPDSLLNQWDSTQYIHFTPAIQGRFRWEHPDELVFSPSQPMAPATDFEAKLDQDLLKFSSYNSIASAEKIQFHTSPLHLENKNITWVLPDGTPGKAVPQLDLYFNYAVDPASLKDKLTINAEGQPLPFSIQTLSADKKISVRLTNVAAKDKDVDISISIGKGIVPAGGKNPTGELLKLTAMIPSPFNLVVNDVSNDHDGIAGHIYIKTSQQVMEKNLSSFIKLDPAIPFTVEVAEDGFTITSEKFNMDKTYQLTLSKGIRGNIGGTLREQYETNIAFGQLEPSISFVNSKAVYLSARGNEQIELKIINVPRVKVIISRIYESNLLAARRYGYYPKEKNAENYEDYYYDDGADYSAGDVIYEKEIDTRSLPSSANGRLLRFNVEDKLAGFKGIYHIKIRSTENYWISDSRFISKTDIGLIAKEGKDKMVVFANSIQNAQPVNGVNVAVYGGNNQVLGLGTTNASGIAEIAYTRKEFAGFRPAMVIARTAEDFNYLPFSNTAVNTSRFDVGGKRINISSLDAFIYAERDIYRPGETIHYGVIVRDKQWKSPGEMPVLFKFLLPNGKELKTFRKNLNGQGATEGSIELQTSSITGTYTLEMYSSNNILLSSQAFNVEEFIPDRIRVSAELDKKSVLPGETAELAIEAANFFGPPAADRNYETEIQVKPSRFRSKKYDEYDFSITNLKVSFDKVVRDGKTDENGSATESYTVPEMFKNTGILQATFYATVFDETGRPVSRSTTADIYTQSTFFGIRDDGYSYYPLNQAVRFPLIALSKDGSVSAGARAEVTVVKHEYRTVLSKSGNYFRYESQKDDKVISKQEITITGENASFTFVPRSPGNYELRLGIPGASSYVSKDFHSYGYWGGDNHSFEVNNEGNIDIEADKASYFVNEKARLLFKTPFSGKLLVTVESDNVLSYQYLAVENRTASMELPLTEKELPNVYVTATLFKPHDVSDIPLTVAHGFTRILVEGKKRRLPVSIVSHTDVRSKTRQKVTVKTEPGSLITLAVVDNGVLQVTDFKTPDPYAYFYAPRALEVNAYDIYPLLFPELRAPVSSTGGDGDIDMEKRVNPMPAKRVRIVSYWSGIRKSDASGNAEFEFDVPSFSGELRLMAVSFKDECFGSSEAKMTVADPIVLSTALPRFLSPGDTVNVPVTISNTTAKPASANASISLQGPLSVGGSSRQTVTVPAHSEQRADFKVIAGQAVALGKVKINVAALGEDFSNETEISVRPASPLQMRTGAGSIAGGQSQRIQIPVSDFLSAGSTYSLIVGRNPALDLAEQLRFLVQYPYGCTEQTVSAAFPQLYYTDLSGLFEKKPGEGVMANENVLQAIRTIRLRQLYNGGIALWDNDGTANWWSSIYAGHFLIEAKKAGFEVDSRLTDGIFAYINDRLKNKETIPYYYNRTEKKKIAPKEVAYTLYVLSLAGRPNVAVMNYYKANQQLLSLDSKYLLSVSYAISGDKERFREILPFSFAGEESIAQTGGSFYSDIRDEAIALNALLDVDPGNAQVPVMAKHVSDKLKARKWYSTQESAFGFLAIGKIARNAAAASVNASILVNGRSVATVGASPLRLTKEQLKGNLVDIKTLGNGRMYYFWQSEGISSSGRYQEEDSYIKVRRKFYNRYGKELSSSSFRQNDLVIVQVTLEKSYGGDVSNIAVTDILPAGFEIENPRTKEIPGMDWIKDASTPASLDVRDDRINLFVDLTSSRQVYYYAVRAVSKGIFRMGPVSAVAMYNGEYHSYNGGGSITVE